MRHHNFLIPAFFALAPLLGSTVARADCAAPRNYPSQVSGNTVVVCTPDEPTGCPNGSAMLRVDETSGAVVSLPKEYGPPPAGMPLGAAAPNSACYTDECVPSGTYQYGCGVPLDCSGSCSGEYAVVVTVTATPSHCAADAGTDIDGGTPPWATTAATGGEVPNPSCVYHTTPPSYDAGTDAPAHGDAGSESDAAVADDADAAAGSDAATGNDAGVIPHSEPEDSGSHSGGCAVVAPHSTEHTILAIDALALAFGLVALGRRRNKRS